MDLDLNNIKDNSKNNNSLKEATYNIFTVTEITHHIKNILESNISAVWVKGEISNFKFHSSGHMYFNLKDENCTINCVFFKHLNRYLRFEPENGMEVICYGKIKVYERNGQYQLYVNQIKPLGIGELEIAFRKLKEKLAEEGFFKQEFKKPIPNYPFAIGIVTSAVGAAIEDIKNVLTRRFPVKLYLYPARVQGVGAANEISKGIEIFNEKNNVDVIIISRGGGSMEDLLPFNEEIVARSIFQSKIPIISAVGHEVDFTISDFTADLRAATPSAAAELVVPDRKSVKNILNNYLKGLSTSLQNEIVFYQNNLKEYKLKLEKNHPQNKIFTYYQRFDELIYRLKDIIKNFSLRRLKLEQIRIKFTQNFKAIYIDQNKEDLVKTNAILTELIKNKYTQYYNQFLNLSSRMEELNPLKILTRGYCLTKKNSKIISSIQDLNIDDLINVQFKDGKCDCCVNKISGVSDEKE